MAGQTRSLKKLLEQGPSRARERAEQELREQRRELLMLWGRDPWEWLTATDPTVVTPDFPKGRPVVWTQDEGDPARPLKPWPSERERPYLRHLVEDVWYSDEPVVWIDKPRQVMATWAISLLADWDCRFHPVRRWLLSKSTEDEACEILRDKPRFMARMLPEWVAAARPSSVNPLKEISYSVTGSRYLAVAQNVAKRDARGGTTSGVIVDEAAFQDQLEDILAACLGGGLGNVKPIKAIVMTTPQANGRGAACFRKNAVEVGFV